MGSRFCIILRTAHPAMSVAMLKVRVIVSKKE